MKTLTTRNPAHPKNTFDDVRQSYKAAIRKYSNVEMDAVCRELGIEPHGLSRKQQIEALVQDAMKRFVNDFETKHGFDPLDEEKYKRLIWKAKLKRPFIKLAKGIVWLFRKFTGRKTTTTNP